MYTVRVGSLRLMESQHMKKWHETVHCYFMKRRIFMKQKILQKFASWSIQIFSHRIILEFLCKNVQKLLWKISQISPTQKREQNLAPWIFFSGKISSIVDHVTTNNFSDHTLTANFVSTPVLGSGASQLEAEWHTVHVCLLLQSIGKPRPPLPK